MPGSDFRGLLTPYILRNFFVTIVPNVFLQEEYKTRYGISPVVIHNPVEVGFLRY